MAADLDIDMGMDIDMDVDPEIERMQAEADAIAAQRKQQMEQAQQQDDMNGIEQAPEEGEVNPNAIVRFKIHLSGSVELPFTKILEPALKEHFDATEYKYMQWVNDMSMNLVFNNEQAAEQAFLSLSAYEEEKELLEFRMVKPLAALPDVRLQMRYAMESDVKVKGAKDQSRFYLFNPEHDPENRKRRFSGPRERGPRYAKRGRYDDADDRLVRRNSAQGVPFNENFYDDTPASAPPPVRYSESRRDSYSSAGSHGRRQRHYDEDLFKGRQTGRLRERDRSASPARDGDGRYGFHDDQPRRQTARRRSRSPLRRSSAKDNHEILRNIRKELFPGHRPSSSNGNRRAPDLFDRTNNGARELFPDKAQHKRQEARVVEHEELANAIGKSKLDDKMPATTTYNSLGPERAGRSSHDTKNTNKGGDLFSRITGGPNSNQSHGRLSEADPMPSDPEFRFKGAGTGAGEANGFSILGASSQRKPSGLAKELFPLKVGSNANGSKPDLFEGRLNGGVKRRNRAEDLF